ncbi:hypothetical protein PR048_009080 [Dryococelus australis]|uniref:Uncharacterized protein n=1 Tax=Dryococelus australis TaxID=614101 RepID=A0ABQ9HYV7_9NEOP|nr:hypothetical protein PR048_009080 [Dryococelus australis]
MRVKRGEYPRAGETGDPRGNPLTSSIVRHDSHMRKPGSEPGSPWWEIAVWKAFSRRSFRTEETRHMLSLSLVSASQHFLKAGSHLHTNVTCCCPCVDPLERATQCAEVVRGARGDSQRQAAATCARQVPLRESRGAGNLLERFRETIQAATGLRSRQCGEFHWLMSWVCEYNGSTSGSGAKSGDCEHHYSEVRLTGGITVLGGGGDKGGRATVLLVRRSPRVSPGLLAARAACDVTVGLSMQHERALHDLFSLTAVKSVLSVIIVASARAPPSGTWKQVPVIIKCSSAKLKLTLLRKLASEICEYRIVARSVRRGRINATLALSRWMVHEEWLGYSPPTYVTRARSPAGSLLDYRMCRTMSLVGGFSQGSPVFAAPYSPHFALIGSQDLNIKGRPNLLTQSRGGGTVVQWLNHSPPTLANRVRFPAGSFPDLRAYGSCLTTPQVGGFPQGSPVSPRNCIPVLLHAHLASPSSALKTSKLRKSLSNISTLSTLNTEA